MVQVETYKLNQLDRIDWNQEVSREDGATYWQTSYSAAFHEAISDFTQAFFLRASINERPVGWLMLLKQFPYDQTLPCKKTLSRLVSPLVNQFNTFTWNYGPLLSVDGGQKDILAAFLDTIDRLALESRIYLIRQAIPAIHDPALLRDELDEIYIQHGYERSMKATVLLRLRDSSSDRLWERLDKDTRRTVRKARTQGVSVAEAVTAGEIEAYYQIRKETARRNGLRIPSLDYFQSILSCFPRNVYRIFLTRYKDKWISGQGVGVFNGNLILGGVCYSDYAKDNSIYGNDLMQWHIIEWACSLKARSIDWMGYFLKPADSHEGGINSYKLKWGGEVVEYPEYNKVFSPARVHLVKLVRRLVSGRR